MFLSIIDIISNVTEFFPPNLGVLGWALIQVYVVMPLFQKKKDPKEQVFLNNLSSFMRYQ